MNFTRRQWLGTAGAATLAAAAPGLLAQSGDNVLRIVVPFAPGNTLDASVRQMAEEYRTITGRTIIVDNKPGGSGVVAATTVMRAPADDNTLLLANTSMLTINPHTFSSLPYDAEKDFVPVTNFLGASMVMAVNAKEVAANTLAEFIAWSKANPGKARYASFTAGNSSHFAGVLLNQRAGIDMLHVPYNGTPPAVQALLAGDVHAAFVPLLAVKGHMDKGSVKLLAVTTPKRSPIVPNVPTFVELGYPDLDIFIWAALVARTGTPPELVRQLNTDITKALRTKAIQDRWAAIDFQPLPTTPEELASFVRADSKRWAEAVRISGFKADQ